MLLIAPVIHGCTLTNLVTSTIIAIPKGRDVNIADFVNYRGIVLSYIYGKISDHIIFTKFSDKLVTSDFQLSFNINRSTNMSDMI